MRTRRGSALTAPILAAALLLTGLPAAAASEEAAVTFAFEGLETVVADAPTDFTVTATVTDRGALADDHPLRFRGTLTSAGAPVAAVPLRYHGPDGSTTSFLTDADGHFSFPPVDAPPVTLAGLPALTDGGARFAFTIQVPLGAYEVTAQALDWAVAEGQVARLGGPSRVETAASISAALYAPGVAAAYVARLDTFPDALTGGPAAALDGAPILLVEPDAVPDATAAELARLRPGRIVVLGGTGAVSQRVAEQLAPLATDPVEPVVRFGGADRFATAAAIATAVFPTGVDTAFIATGGNFPDALAGAAAAGTLRSPVLLTGTDELPGATADALRTLRPGRVVVLGGSHAVSDAVTAALADLTQTTVERYAGPDRFATAATISARTFAAPAAEAFVATGANFPDALAAAAPAGARGAPVLLTGPDALPESVTAELQRLTPHTVHVAGLQGVVGDSVVTQLEGLARDVGPDLAHAAPIGAPQVAAWTAQPPPPPPPPDGGEDGGDGGEDPDAGAPPDRGTGPDEPPSPTPGAPDEPPAGTEPPPDPEPAPAPPPAPPPPPPTGPDATAAPALAAAPSAVRFGDVTVGQRRTATLRLTNTGDRALRVDAITTGRETFVATPVKPLPQRLAAGASLDVTVAYTPKQAGAEQTEIVVRHSGRNSPLRVPVSGTGRAAPVAGVLHRVNAGGPQLPALDSGPPWQADEAPDSALRTSGSLTGSFPGSAISARVPDTTPPALFDTERWDPPEPPEMAWQFPVAAGTPIEVRLYFNDGYSGTSAPGDRVFDVTVDGATVLDDYDIIADAGDQTGTMRSFPVTSDGTVDVTFSHVVENPQLNGIEIIAVPAQPAQLGVAPSTVRFGSVVVTGGTATQDVTIRNLGAAGDPTITVDATTIVGTNKEEFSDGFNDAANVVLAPGDATTIPVTFDPTAAGARSASLRITHSGSNSPVTVALTGEGASQIPVGFGVSGLTGVSLSNPTSLQFGPDGRLYVAQQSGLIVAYSIQRTATNAYSVTGTEQIDEILDLPNHNDDGSTNGAPSRQRQVTGLLATGTAAQPVLYVTSSDPRISVSNDSNLDTNSGIVSRLTRSGSGWAHAPLVRGLPRSEENHSLNGLELDESTNTLYVMAGGNTNKGAPGDKFSYTPEYALSAAMLAIDLDAVGNGPYDLPTLGDSDPSPFGGRDGANMAKLVSGGPVQVHAPGFRNAYDVVRTEAGRLYTIDNGPNTDWGGTPVNEGPGGTCTNGPNEGDSEGKRDSLHLVTGPGYYGGHPNPTRGNPQGSGFPGAVPSANPVECDYRSPNDPAENGALTTWGASTNGFTEYTASNFGGALAGDLFAASFDGKVHRVQLNATGDAVVANTSQFSNFGSTPLDVTAQGDDDVFPGTVWAATYGSNAITVFEPNDFGGGGSSTCNRADDPQLDADADGYSNADEIDNNTDPCSAADVPPDADGDFVSDRNDPDDDNDGRPDTTDAFAVDAANGLSTALPTACPSNVTTSAPACLRFNPGSFPGTITDLGFTGLMTNGTDYLDLFDPDNLIAGGAANVFTVQRLGAGDPIGNSQESAFQLGVNPGGRPFTAHTRVLAPFPSGSAPADYQSVGFYLGTGSQDDYVKLVASANGGAGGLQLAKEVGGAFTSVAQPTTAAVVGDGKAVDLYLAVVPATGQVTASYRVDGGPRVTVGTTTVPTGWLDGGDAGVAVGLLGTTFASGKPLGGSWDVLEVTADAPPPATTVGATFAMTPGQGINASTYGGGSFRLTNTSQTQRITTARVDLDGGLFGDLVFDPDGVAGDTTAKGFTVDSPGGVQVLRHRLVDPHNGTTAEGYDVLELTLAGFDPGETLTFSIDVDPTSIKGVSAPGPGDSGSVSGLELAGTDVSVGFDNGAQLVGEAFTDGSAGGAIATVRPAPPAAPRVTLGGATTPRTVGAAAQTVTIEGSPNATVQLLRVEGGLFLPPGGGYDVDPFEANSAVAVQQPVISVRLDGAGRAQVPVTLTRRDASSGLNHLVAAQVGGGQPGRLSNILVLKYE